MIAVASANPIFEIPRKKSRSLPSKQLTGLFAGRYVLTLLFQQALEK